MNLKRPFLAILFFGLVIFGINLFVDIAINKLEMSTRMLMKNGLSAILATACWALILYLFYKKKK